MKKSLLSLSLVSLSLGLFALGACSSTTVVTTSDGDASTTTDGSTTSTDAGTTKDSSTTVKDSGTPTPADTCASESSNQACQQCCAQSNTAAYNAFTQTLITCACQDTVCKTQCGTTLCAATPANPSAECQTCLGTAQSGACQADIQKACTGSGACAPFADCVQNSCAGKK